MNKKTFFDTFRDIDPKYIESAAPREKRGKGRHSLFIKLAAAACLVLMLSAAAVPMLFPKLYHVDGYIKEYGMNEVAYSGRNVWIYYAENGRVKREFVKLEDSRMIYLFATWQAANSLEEGRFNRFERNDDGSAILYVEGIPQDDEALIKSLKKTFINYMDGTVGELTVVFDEPKKTNSYDKEGSLIIVSYDPVTGETVTEEIACIPDPDSTGEISPPYIPNN